MQLVAASALCVALANVAPADSTPKKTVVVMPLEVRGALGDESRVQLEDGIAAGLARGNFEVIPPSKIPAAVTAEPSCGDAACFKQRASALHAAYLVRTVVVAGEDRNYVATLTLVDGETGETAAESSEDCEVCGQQELRELIEDQGAAMREKLDDLVKGPPVLLARSAPDGAFVRVDGELVGTTPLRRELAPGKHIARVEKDGYVTLERAFLAVGGVEETLTFELEKLPKRRANLRPLGWVGLGVGVGTLAAGATFLALDERAAPGDRCNGNNVDDQGNCRFRYDTLTPGVVLTVTGAVLVTAAVILLVRSRKRGGRRGARSSRHRTSLFAGNWR